MKLFSDTIGRKVCPTEADVKEAIAYGGDKYHINDLVKLEIDTNNYLSIWIGDKESGHRLELKQNGKKNIECTTRFDSETAIKIMICYLNGSIDWIQNYQWEKPVAVKFLENLEHLQRAKDFRS